MTSLGKNLEYLNLKTSVFYAVPKLSFSKHNSTQHNNGFV